LSGLLIETNLKSRNYDYHEVVRIVNPKQYLLYIKNGVFPIDLYTSVDGETGNIILAMIFLKADTTEVYKKWCSYDLK